MKRKRLYLEDGRGNPTKNHKDDCEPIIRKRLQQTSDHDQEEPSTTRPRVRRRLSTPSASEDGDRTAQSHFKSTSVDQRGVEQHRNRLPGARRRLRLEESDTKVGPKNPPKQTRFRPGVSGNPNGRPKGSKNLATILTEAAERKVKATIDGKLRKITTVQAAAFQLATKAANGDLKALAQFLDWMDEVEHRAAARSAVQYPLCEDDECVIDELYERMLKSRSIEEGDEP